MQQIIVQLANEAGIAIDEANYIFIAITSQLVTKIPALQQVIEDVFENVDTDKLKQHINKLILLLQEQQSKETFGAWIIPKRNEITHQEGNHPLF